MSKKPKSQNSDSKRGYAFCFVIYPDNEKQMALFDWLNHRDCPYLSRLVYIRHDAEEEDKKDHIHCMIRFDSQKTVGAVKKMFGIQADVWRLYTLIESDVIDDLKMKHGTPERVRNIVYKKSPVLSDPADSESFIEFPYDKSNLYNAKMVSEKYPDLHDDQAFIRTKVYTVPHIEVVSDCNAYALYMLHANYDSIIQGKKPYKKEELRGNYEFILSLFPELKNMNELHSVKNLYDLTRRVVNQTMSRRDLVAELIQTGDEDTLKYLKENSHFVKDWLLDNWKKESF